MRRHSLPRSFSAIAFMLLAICGAIPVASAQAPVATLPAWLSGCWERRTPRSLIEEQWMAPRAGIMLGFARTTRGDSLLEYEFVRIHRRGAQLVYEAHPSAQASAEFAGTIASDTLVAFANPAHDFPQRIFYRRRGADSLLARVEGTMGGSVRGTDFRYARVDCAHREGGQRAALADSLTTIFDSVAAIHTDHPDTVLLRRLHPATDTILHVEGELVEKFTGDSLLRRVVALHGPVRSMRQEFFDRSVQLLDTRSAILTANERVNWVDAEGAHTYKGILTLAVSRLGNRWIIRAYRGT